MRHVARVAWHARGVESTDQRRLRCPQTTARVYAEFLVVRGFLLLRWTPRTPLGQWLLAATTVFIAMRSEEKVRSSWCNHKRERMNADCTTSVLRP